ncbi:MAG: toluene tolerance protein [Acidiferrobacteraceae bacterium]|nr:toluene tolerance protein [Acidiferrobacteraceae bacterium]
MNRYITISGACICLVFVSLAAPPPPPPNQLINDAVNQLIVELSERRVELEKDRSKLYGMVERVIVEHISVDRVAKLVLARHWRDASAKQQNQFAELFKNLLIHTYASAFFEYTGQEKIHIRPTKFSDDGRIASVRTDMWLSSGQPIPVNYKFVKLETGEWKIFDVTINGISLVTTYRAGYGRIIQTQGLDGLIIRLRHKMAELQ